MKKALICVLAGGGIIFVVANVLGLIYGHQAEEVGPVFASEMGGSLR